MLLNPEAPEPGPGALLLDDGRIEAVLELGEAHPEDAEVVDLRGNRVAPGFVDLHFHGRTIFAAPDARSTADALRHDAAALLRGGTTSFLATTVAEAAGPLAERVTSLAAAAADSGQPGARPVGIHLEGPWISSTAAGAQPREGIRAPDPAELGDLISRAGGGLRMLTLAPELEGASRLLEMLGRHGVLGALGHSLASADEVGAAVAEGARHVTHLFNAMGPTHHRAPGLAGATLADDRLSCDLICDGAHVDPIWVRLAARCKGKRLVLISDCIDPPESGPGFGSGALRSDGIALRLPDGRLAGSCVTLARSVQNAQRFAAMTQLDAVRACTELPARLLGIEADCGTLRRGARADLVVLDDAGELQQTWLGGEPSLA